MQKIRKFNTMFETEEAEEDKHEMKAHTRAMVMKIMKRGKKHEQEPHCKHSHL